jgi:hypothetical protein
MPQTPSRLSGGKFHKLTVAEFQALLDSVTPHRRIDSVHLHHTWIPRHEDFNGVGTIVAMWKHHTQQEKWSDIAQHLTVDTEGALWTGRHWDLPPASARGHNGSEHAGPFMIEMIGNFDERQNPFKDPQRSAAFTVLALLLDKFDLPTSSIRFHNEMSAKTCPGQTIDRVTLLTAVESLRDAGGRAALPVLESPFSEEDDSIWQARAFLRSDVDGEAGTRSTDPVIAETYAAELMESLPPEDGARRLAAATALESAARDVRDVDVALTPAIKESLRPYVVNLTRGKFSTTGEFTTSKADVDTIFDEHLPKALADVPSARPLPIVVYAHGGLVGEKDGLGVALKHVDWWRANGVYPIYFVWETDFLTSLSNAILGAIGGGRAAAPRDVLDIVDAQIEAAARRAKVNSIWADMKHVAERSSQPDGGAHYVASRLGAFCTAHPGAVEVHAVGHSAGSNFHSFFVPVALDAGVPSFTTLQFLAPAITVDAFFSTIARRLGEIGPITMFTMKDSFERDDDCKRIYNKSLLYLIHHALEEQRETDLLGLEISVRNDLRLRRLWGLDGLGSPRGHEVIWSVTTSDRRSSSGSVSHGGFDDDPATMNSVLRRVLGLTGGDEVPKEFVQPSRSVDVDAWSAGADLVAPAPTGPSAPAIAPAPTWSPGGPSVVSSNGGRRRAICVGINAYKRKPLRGCVADAERWAETLKTLGFEVPPPLRDAEATGDRILAALSALVRQSSPGDVLVFQYSGHGTTLPDRSGDEVGGDSPGEDEALCPYDFTEGRFIVDDELAAIFGEAADAGVRITSFIDCCHSGTISRLGFGPAVDVPMPSHEDRARFVEARAEEIAAHLARKARAGIRHLSPRASTVQRDVLFSACRSTEVAWETGMQGDFTRHATSVLRSVAGSTNASLLDRIQSAFGPAPRQHPELHPPDAAPVALFGGLGQESPTNALNRTGFGLPPTESGDVATLLRTVADLMSR